MSATLTITGTAGPANAVTAGVFAGVTEFRIVPDTNMIYFTMNGQVREISVAAATTITATKSGANWTLSIS